VHIKTAVRKGLYCLSGEVFEEVLSIVRVSSAKLFVVPPFKGFYDTLNFSRTRPDEPSHYEHVVEYFYKFSTLQHKAFRSKMRKISRKFFRWNLKKKDRHHKLPLVLKKLWFSVVCSTWTKFFVTGLTLVIVPCLNYF